MCLYLLWGYADKKRTSILMKILTVAGWFLSFALVVFLPVDIYLTKARASISNKNMSPDDPDSTEGEPKDYALIGWWALSYWLGNILGFFIIPLVQGYVIAGEFKQSERI